MGHLTVYLNKLESFISLICYIVLCFIFFILVAQNECEMLRVYISFQAAIRRVWGAWAAVPPAVRNVLAATG